MSPTTYNIAKAYSFGYSQLGWETVKGKFPKKSLGECREAYYLGYNDYYAELEACDDSFYYGEGN